MVDPHVPPDEVPPAHEAQRQQGAQRAGDAARWSRVKAAFLEALDQPESERSSWLARACEGDAGLEAEVASLLASEHAAAGFCETPAAEAMGIETLSVLRPAPRLEPGARLGAYEITAFLSAGGMGEVYRARHTLLDRQVAIKIVNAQSTDPVAKRRLIREARHASILGHPNICTIHEVGEAGGTPFIVMGFVDGRPLSEILRGAVPSLDDTLDYGMQLADALEHAHQHGIVHRDLKSSNVVVDTTGRPVVLDFGLARHFAHGTGQPVDSTETVEYGLAGTLSHMAPEVLLGGAADSRSDIWSLGVLLYELATGELPFQGRTPFETTSAILNEPPRPIGGRIPLGLRLVIERCLVKEREGRYQRAAEVRDALHAIRRRRAWPLVGRLLVSSRRRTIYAIATAAVLVAALLAGGHALRERLGGLPGGRISTLAFLPLENATADPELEYYSAGLTGALMEQLGTAADVRVISPTSAARAASTAATRAEAARSLNADALIEGRLRQASDRIAVDIRLIDAARGRVLWSDTYERSAQQVLALQADVIRALATEVRLTVRPGAQERLATARAVNPEAYEAYLKGRYEWNQRTHASLQLAIAHFTRAIELDPTYAPAHAALADCYNQFGTVLLAGPPQDYRPLAAAAAIRALQIDPYSAEAHAALGYVRHYDWQWQEAEREFRRAIELHPSFALAHIWYANLLMSRNRMKEALEQVFVARELDPFSLVINTNVGWVLTLAGRTQESIALLTRTLELDSTYIQARSRLVDALTMAGMYAAALEQAERVVTLSHRSPHALKNLAVVRTRLGRTDEVRPILAELLAREHKEYVPPATLAWLFILLGDNEAAIPWMSRAFEERSNAMAYIDVDPAWDGLRQDPRFQAMVARTGLR
jgi:TolB-like protein/Tfp pilus assembly protein PilF